MWPNWQITWWSLADTITNSESLNQHGKVTAEVVNIWKSSGSTVVGWAQCRVAGGAKVRKSMHHYHTMT